MADWHVAPWQSWPQLPQFEGSVVVSTHWLAQSVCVAPQPPPLLLEDDCCEELLELPPRELLPPEPPVPPVPVEALEVEAWVPVELDAPPPIPDELAVPDELVAPLSVAMLAGSVQAAKKSTTPRAKAGRDPSRSDIGASISSSALTSPPS